MNAHRILILIVIAAGVALRFTGITIPDLSTDEAQFVLGASAAQPPLGMWFFRAAQALLGHDILTVRLVSVLFGILTLPLIFGIARRSSNEPTALLITAIAAIFPSHVLFSRLAYLSVPLSFAWALLLLAFLRARAQPEPGRLIALYAASVLATFIKTQGLLLPLLLLIGSVVEERKSGDNFQFPISNQFSIFNFQFSIVLFLSLIPITLYILTHPGIAATVLLYGGNMYGLSDAGARIVTLIATWRTTIGLFLIALIVSLPFLKTFPWPVRVLIGIAALTGLLLGPGHSYYATPLVLFALPIGAGLMRLQPALRNAAIGVLLTTTLAMLGPWRTPWSNPLFAERGFWNTHAAEINEALRGEKTVTVLGSAGHHVRWYLEPEVLVGNNMQPPYPTDHAVLLGISGAGRVRGGTIEYVSGYAAVIRLRK